MNKPIKYPLAKLLKEKGFDKQFRDFYTKPNSKMFSIDEHYRNYPIKNIPKKLYAVGLHAVLNVENVYPAPTISDVVMWIYEKHGIWINVSPCMTFKDGNLREYEETSFSFMYSIKYGTKELFLKNSNELI